MCNICLAQMTSRCLLILAIILIVSLSNYVEGIRKTTSKDIVKTIKTEDGFYDCVDFYKQPALNHPSLKNHSFHPQMRPSFGRDRSKVNEKYEEGSFDIKLKGETCPQGSVPIRKFDHRNHKHLHQSRRHSYAQLGESCTTNGWSPSNIYFALGQSRSDVRRVYNGIAATLSVFNPYVEKYQYSSGEIIIKGGNDVIITGWTVNPVVYTDTQTRFFIYTISGDSHCFNSQCGFIQVRSDIPLDFPLKPISTVEGPKYTYKFFVQQDPHNGNWWLTIGENGDILGFWPQDFFHGLYKSGTYVACGGEVYGPPEMGYPNMGSGYKPKSRVPDWSYCHNVKVVDEAQNVVRITDMEDYSSNDNYNIDVYEKGDKHFVFYGGPHLY